MANHDIQCPHCKAKIIVDGETGAVVEHQAQEKKKADLGEFLKSQKNRGTELENLFKKSKDEETKRKEQLQKDFQRVKENPDELKGMPDPQSPFLWD